MSWTPDYLRGYLDALWSFAWWKEDGTAYVGSISWSPHQGMTYREAEEWAYKEAGIEKAAEDAPPARSRSH